MKTARKLSKVPREADRPRTMTSRPRIRDLGYSPGRFKTGKTNSLLDVEGNFGIPMKYNEVLIQVQELRSAKKPYTEVRIYILELP
jgi:hypothetical protein